MKTRQKILLGFSVPLLLMTIIATVVYFSIGKLLDTSQWVQHTQRVIADGHELTKHMIDMETGERGFLITGKDHFLEPFNNSQKVWDDKIVELKTLVEDNPLQVERLEKINALEKDWLTQAAAPEIEMRRKVGKATVDATYLQEILSLGEGKRIIDEFMAVGHEVEVFFSGRGDWEGAFATEIIEKSMADREDSQRGFLITGEEAFLEKYTAGEQIKLPAYFARLRAITSDRGFENELMGKVEQMEQLASEWTLKAAEPEIAARREMNKHPESLSDVVILLEKETGKKIVDAIRSELVKFNDVESSLMKTRVQQAEAAASNTIVLIIVSTIFAIVIALFVAFMVSGTIVKRLEVLLGATKKVSEGDFTKNINIENKDEIGQLAKSFNKMTVALMMSRDQMVAANDDLIIEKEKAEVSETKFRNLVEGSLQGIFVHRDFKPLFANQVCAEIFGYSNPEEILELDSLLEAFWTPEEQERIRGYKTGRMAGGESPNIYECQGRRKDGSLFWIENHVTTIDWQGEKAIQAAVIDITERKHMEDELKHMATHDPLTGLYDRNVLDQRLNDEIHRASRYNHAMSVFMLDIDHFKPINDTYGHGIGDTVLRNFSKVLESSIRNTDYAARYGGEEFVVILPETPLPKAEELAERLRNKVAEYPFPIEDDKDLNLTVSIGIATFPEHAQTGQELLEVADSAMYAAKKAGRNQVKSA